MKFLKVFLTLILISAIFTVPLYAQGLRENVPGSFLLIPKFDIRGDTSSQVRIVNTGESNINVYLLFVCPGVKNVNQICSKLDTTISFTPHQTRVVDVFDLNPPCDQGYITGYAYGAGGQFDAGGIPAKNKPISYNYLTGSYNIHSVRTVEASNAIASQALAPDGVILPSSPKVGVDYAGTGDTLYTDFLAISPAVGLEPARGSRITLVDLNTTPGVENPPAVVFVDFWNAAEVPYSSSLEFVCWTETELDDINVNFLEDNLGTKHGSTILTTFGNCPLPGGCPPLFNHTGIILGTIVEYGDGYSAGRNLVRSEPKSSVIFRDG